MLGSQEGLETDQSSVFQQQHRGCLFDKNKALLLVACRARELIFSLQLKSAYSLYPNF